MIAAARPIAASAAWLRARSCLTIAIFFALSLALFAAFSVGNSLGQPHSLDRAIVIGLRAPGGRPEPLGGFGLQSLMGELTGLGDHSVVTVLIAGACAYLVITGRRALALVIAGAAASGGLLVWVVKLIAARPGHDIVNMHTYHVVEVWADSFPSGHATLAAIVYLMLGALVAAGQKPAALKAFAIGLAVALTAIIGFTRVYLGIHYPTDVFGGWAIGSACAFVWMSVAHHVTQAALAFAKLRS